jgi:hypothetical protein
LQARKFEVRHQPANGESAGNRDAQLAPIAGGRSDRLITSFDAAQNGRDWHVASFYGNAALRSLSERSGHAPASKTGWIGRK